jgi:hypothetical protein
MTTSDARIHEKTGLAYPTPDELRLWFGTKVSLKTVAGTYSGKAVITITPVTP